jgi:outer membrane cobalamin receptor
MKELLNFFIICCISVTSLVSLKGQTNNYLIHGKVLDVNGHPISYATVAIQNTTLGTVTDLNGIFKLPTDMAADIELVIRCVGYQEKTIDLNLNGRSSLEINEVLKENTATIGEVVVAGKTKAALLREESYAVEIIESKAFKNLAINANEILNKVPGVNVRQSGGFGEDADLSLNGLTGSQVRVFIDGIPMEYFGSSLSLTNFPANIIDQIEVYKGVVPIHLSADALGGAVNITTSKTSQSFLDASYSYGSFNTHKASINSQYRNDVNGLTARVKSFYNYSDNNYKVDINLYDEETGNYDDFTTTVEHFHDAYDSKMGWFEAGFTNTNFADELMLGIMYSDNYNEVQQPTTALGDSEQPYGEVLEKENKLISTLNYSKQNVFTKNLSFSTYLVYVNSEYIYKNISSYVYDWYGNKTLEDDGTGEGDDRKTYLTLDSRNTLGNVNLEYALSDVNNLAINYNVNFLNLEGEDPYNSENNTRFSDPIKFNKQVVASSYTHSFFDNNFRNTAFVKYYKYTQSSIDTDYFGEDTITTSTDYNHLGYGLASSYFFNKIQLKVSLEHAVRFPDVIELYGDGTNYDANPYLDTEESNNFNVGVIYKNNFSKKNVLFSINGFIRDSKNFIFEQRQGQSIVYENLEDVLTTGVDFSANYNQSNRFNFNLAGTYINQVNNQEYIAGSKNSLYKERVPNEPYLYGNMTASYAMENVFLAKDNFSFNVYENYVHEFDYRWSILGFSDTKYVVPSQLTTDIDFVYSFQNQKYNFSFGIVNLFDTDTYDNLYQQNPGRSYNFKLRYFIN